MLEAAFWGLVTAGSLWVGAGLAAFARLSERAIGLAMALRIVGRRLPDARLVFDVGRIKQCQTGRNRVFDNELQGTRIRHCTRRASQPGKDSIIGEPSGVAAVMD